MTNSQINLSVGARSSQLSLAQTKGALGKLQSLLPLLNCTVIPYSSPGDRDKSSDLRNSAPDFFTRDLDNDIINEKIDCAIHSAKDLPEALREGLDYFYLPWREDPRDVLVCRKDADKINIPRVGISSERREAYAREHFSKGQILHIRGDVENRIAQLDRGDYDVLIMAAAGLIRLGLRDRISEYISLSELPAPEGQGELALLFKRGNPIFVNMRKLFLKPLVFAGAGIGTKDNTTMGVVEALKKCDVCLYDALAPQELLQYLSSSAEMIYVGKREGIHSFTQDKITKMLVEYSRRGRRVVRLKGGDPGMFGRLAEEIAALDELKLPYKVLPGVSALNVATTGSGMLLTRRDVSRGFTVSTPRKSGLSTVEWLSDAEKKSLPQVLFMGVSELKKIIVNLLNDGYLSNTKISLIYNAGYPDREIISGTLEDIVSKQPKLSMPGIVIIGEVADSKYLFKNHGALNGMRILFTGSEALQEKVKNIIEDFGGIPILMPMIKLKLLEGIEESIDKIFNADYLIVNSPSSASFLFEALKKRSCDLRRLPKIAVCGKATEEIFIKHNIFPDICPSENYSAEALLKSLEGEIKSSDKIVRLCSDKSSSTLTDELLKLSDNVENINLYTNESIDYDTLPEFDAILFTSPSTVNSFFKFFSPSLFINQESNGEHREMKPTCGDNKIISVIGEPTKNSLSKVANFANVIKSNEATVYDMVYSLAVRKVIDLFFQFKQLAL